MTPTPRSTNLPPVPTSIPAGAEGNPIRVIFPRIESGSAEAAITAAVSDLEAELRQSTGLVVDVELVDSDAEALAQLCASTPDAVTTAWLNGVGYAAAFAQDCGSAELSVSRGSLNAMNTSAEIVLYGNRDKGATSLDALAGKIICRLSVDDLYTWLIPSVLLRTGSEDLTAQVREIVDYADLNELIDALANGDCDAAGMNEADFEERANQSTRSATTQLARSAPIPFAIFSVSAYLPIGQASGLIDAFMTIGNGAQSDLLRPLLQQDQIEQVDDPDFSRLRSFFNQASLNLSELGT